RPGSRPPRSDAAPSVPRLPGLPLLDVLLVLRPRGREPRLPGVLVDSDEVQPVTLRRADRGVHCSPARRGIRAGRQPGVPVDVLWTVGSPLLVGRGYAPRLHGGVMAGGVAVEIHRGALGRHGTREPVLYGAPDLAVVLGPPLLHL